MRPGGLRGDVCAWQHLFASMPGVSCVPAVSLGVGTDGKLQFADPQEFPLWPLNRKVIYIDQFAMNP